MNAPEVICAGSAKALEPDWDIQRLADEIKALALAEIEKNIALERGEK